MKRWSKNHKRCVNCGTARRRHAGRGYCTRCYFLVRKLHAVEMWNLAEPTTLSDYPRDPLFHNPTYLNRLRKGSIAQISERLNVLRDKEEMLSRAISGLEIEYQLRRLAKRAGARDPHLHFGVGTFISQTFDSKRRRILFRLLLEIEESIPWGGINLYRLDES